MSNRYQKTGNSLEKIGYAMIIVGVIMIIIGNIGSYYDRNYECKPKSETVSQEI